MRRPVILIDGIGFRNRGAWLMLEAVLAQVRERLPDAVVAIPAVAYWDNPSWCQAHGIVRLMRTDGLMRRFRVWRADVRALFFRRPQPVVPSQVDLVLDAAGYKYSDKFGERTEAANRDELDYYRLFCKRNRKIVLLPQAFGPFADKLQRERILNEWPHFDRVYVRDATSDAYLRGVVGNDSKVRCAHDFTCLLDSARTVRRIDGAYALIIPNRKMLTSTSTDVQMGYLDFLVGIARHLIGKGLKVVLLDQGGSRDAELNADVARKVGSDALSVIAGASAMECKALIGGAKLLVSSRFHGVISGLLQGVPTLCTSWSHKYEELSRAFAVDGNCLDPTDLPGALVQVDAALESPRRFAADAKRVQDVKASVRKMWDEIFDFASEAIR